MHARICASRGLRPAPNVVGVEVLGAMNVLCERCCGLDAHQVSVVPCLVQTAGDGAVTKEVRTFAATSDELLALADWLRAACCCRIRETRVLRTPADFSAQPAIRPRARPAS